MLGGLFCLQLHLQALSNAPNVVSFYVQQLEKISSARGKDLEPSENYRNYTTNYIAEYCEERSESYPKIEIKLCYDWFGHFLLTSPLHNVYIFSAKLTAPRITLIVFITLLPRKLL